MMDITPAEPRERPTLEVVVFQDGHEVARELCESAEAASLIVDWWSEQEGAQCEVHDLSLDHRPDDILEPSAEELDEADYGADETP